MPCRSHPRLIDDPAQYGVSGSTATPSTSSSSPSAILGHIKKLVTAASILAACRNTQTLRGLTSRR